MTFNYFSTKAAFELAVNAFRKSFSTWPVCLVAMENRIFRKLKSIWPEFYSFDPEIVLHFHFTFKPFPGHAQKRDIVYLFSNRENVRKCDRIWWFFFLGFVCVSVLRNEWNYIFVWQPRKCEKMCFLWYFQEHNQTPENIFQNIFWNATKHMKTFSFSEIEYFPKILLHKPNGA